MNIFMLFLFIVIMFSAVIVFGLWIVFYVFPSSNPGKTFFRIFVDGDYDGQ